MKKTIISLALVLALCIPMSETLAAGAQRKAKPKVRKIVSAVCPVMGTKIPDVRKAAGKSVYNGKIYYFCCKGCKPAFDKNPTDYVKPPTPTTVSAVCPVMGTKIPDVTKAAGKSVYNGKTYYFCCPGCKPAFDKDPAKYVKQEMAR